MASLSLPPHALAALLEKYGQLVQLRAQRDHNPQTPATREGKLALRSLSQRHPGCLRELDRLSLVELQQRQAAVAAALASGEVPPWMLWIWGYHQLLGAALSHKAGRPATTIAGWPLLEPAYLEEVLHPPGGRVSRLALAELARQVQQPPEILAATLFPPRRIT